MLLHLCIAAIVIYASIRKTRKLWRGSASAWVSPRPPKKRNRKSKASRAFHQAFNPVMLKDLRYTLGLAGRNGICMASLTFLISASATAILLYQKPPFIWNDYSRGIEGWMLLRALFMPLIVVAFCVPLVHNEKTYRTLDARRSTMLTPSEILKGKVLAMCAVCCAFVLTALAADLPHLLYRFNAEHEGIMLLAGAGTLITCMMLTISTSLAAAVFLDDRNTAFVVSMITLFCFLIGNYWIVNFLIYPMLEIYPRHPRGVANLDFVFSPIMALYNQIDSIRYGRPHYYQWTITMLLYNSISAALITIAFRGYRKRIA